MKLDYEGLPRVKVGGIEVMDVRGLFPDRPGYGTRDLSTIEHIVIHHSADTSIAVHGSQDTGPRLTGIYNWHTGNNGWPGIGYHFVVDNWGHRFLVGGVETVRYHVAGKNARSIGVNLLGNFEYYVPSMWQLLAARELVDNIRFGLGRPLPLTGHGEYALESSPTSCPGATFPQWRFAVDSQLQPHIVGGDYIGTLLNNWLRSQGR